MNQTQLCSVLQTERSVFGHPLYKYKIRPSRIWPIRRSELDPIFKFVLCFQDTHTKPYRPNRFKHGHKK